METYSEILKKQQPVVYRTLSNALKQDRLSHSYLFSGPKGSGKKQAAFLLAQSLVCLENKNSFACEKCSNCVRIKENNYSDFIYVQAKTNTIRLQDLEDIKQRFDKTALEKAGKKIFIINECEKLTFQAANSLLKFIEEPTNNLTGIFLTSQVENVLPTIVSRCQNVNFRPLSKKDFYDYCQSLNMSELYCHMISQLVSSQQEIIQYKDSKTFAFALEAFSQFMEDYLDNNAEAFIELQDDFVKQKKMDDKSLREAIGCFIDVGLIFFQDYLQNYQSEDEDYKQLLDKAKANGKFNCSYFMKVFAQCNDNLKKAANGLLCIDRLVYRLKEEELDI